MLFAQEGVNPYYTLQIAIETDMCQAKSCQTLSRWCDPDEKICSMNSWLKERQIIHGTSPQPSADVEWDLYVRYLCVTFKHVNVCGHQTLAWYVEVRGKSFRVKQ